jgi:hypothetical protein
MAVALPDLTSLPQDDPRPVGQLPAYSEQSPMGQLVST